MKAIICFSFFLLSILGSLSAQTVNDIQLCEGVEKWLPVNPKNTFQVGETAYCWLNMGGKGDKDMVIRVNWIYDGSLQHSQPLNLGFKSLNTPRFRTNANKSLTYAGEWRVEVLNTNREILTSADFKVIGKISPFPGRHVLGAAPKGL